MESNIVEMIKNSFTKFTGDYGLECAGGNISSQVLSACLQGSQFEDVPPSNCFVSGQRCCSAAISS